MLLIALFPRPLEVPRQQITSEDDQSNREEPSDRNKREGPNNLNNQEQSSRDQHYSNKRRALDERALEPLFINCRALAASDQHRGTVGINYRIEIKNKASECKDSGGHLEACELEKAYDRNEVNHCFDVLSIVDGAHPRQHREQRSQPCSASWSGVAIVSRKALDTKHDAILAIGITFYSMIARLTKRPRAARALDASGACCVI